MLLRREAVPVDRIPDFFVGIAAKPLFRLRHVARRADGGFDVRRGMDDDA